MARDRVAGSMWVPASMAALLLAACGDPLLPADYSGPPADTVTADVEPQTGQTVASDDAAHPRMALEWLDGSVFSTMARPTGQLIGQNVSYRRSQSLESDSVEIDFDNPTASAQFQPDAGAARVAIGKVVYFDDRNQNGKMDWDCSGPGCDVVKSVSRQFVVFVDLPPLCSDGLDTIARAKIARGYHYFDMDQGEVHESAEKSLSFQIVDLPPSAVDPTADLESFSRLLVTYWRSSRTGC